MIAIDEALVRRLVAAQFPQWAGLGVRAVDAQGWDNRTFRLGETVKIRLPAAAGYAAQAAKEHRWLPVLAPHLPVAIPAALGLGAPGEGFAFDWSVQSWIAGVPAAARGDIGLARDVARTLVALRGAPTEDGPRAGAHSFHRGGELSVYDAEVREAARALRGEIDTERALATWDAALASRWDLAPVWVHGDVAPGNLLVAEERLVGLIDFGCLSVGDPACDLAIAWTLFDGEAREIFRHGVAVDADCWARARGWALWKAMITLARNTGDAAAREVIGDVLAER